MFFSDVLKLVGHTKNMLTKTIENAKNGKQRYKIFNDDPKECLT
jgi:hypothetical protein